MPYDRDEVLARTDLAGLADEVLGERKGRGASASWRCPEPGHGPQTGRTPPVTVFTGRAGIERWHCHGCGADGTAIDLIMRTQGVVVRDALALLAARAGVAESSAPRLRRPGRARPAPPVDLPPLGPGGAAVAEYVDECERHLWSPVGEPWRAWLATRRLPEGVLRANRVGADPGPADLRRARGFPRRGPAVVFPVLTDTRAPAYLQARYLEPERTGRKYDNPSDSLARNPRAALVCTPRRGASAAAALLVCEGLPDALTAAAAGYRAAAVLGAALPDVAVARRIAELARGDPIVVAFDSDESGRRGATRLHELLRTLSPDPVAVLAVPAGDLNDWACRSGPAFSAELARQTRPTAPTPATHAPHPAPAPSL